MTSFKYYDSFKAYYREWLSGMDSSNIVDYERNLSALIDSDLFDDCILSDEISMLYDIIQDECVCRFSRMVTGGQYPPAGR